MRAPERIIHDMRIDAILLAMGVSAVYAGIARAGDGIEPEVLEPQFAWLALLYAVVAGVAVGVVAFKNAKRTHLD